MMKIISYVFWIVIQAAAIVGAAEFLVTQKGKQRIADALLDAIIEINDYKLV